MKIIKNVGSTFSVLIGQALEIETKDQLEALYCFCRGKRHTRS